MTGEKVPSRYIIALWYVMLPLFLIGRITSRVGKKTGISSVDKLGKFISYPPDWLYKTYWS